MEDNKPLIKLLDEIYRTGETRTFYETGIKVDDEERFVTFTAAPLRDDDRTEVIGVITYMTDVTDLVLAKRAAEREHAVLQALQERLLPAGLPVLPQVQVAARYRAAGEQLAAGGDWYDAVALRHGRLAASVGDVLGHGPGAAAVMGQLRSVLSAALLHTGDVVAALRQLEQFVQTLPSAARGSTACAVTFDPAGGRLCYATAGHPAPLLIGPDGTAVDMTRRVRATEAGSALPPKSTPDTASTLNVRLTTTAHGTVGVLSGDLDAAGVPAAALALRGAARGGVLPLTVDLTGLEHLTSAGVKLLFDLAAEATSVGNQLTVQVARGSAPYHVLELTGFADLAVINLATAS